MISLSSYPLNIGTSNLSLCINPLKDPVLDECFDGEKREWELGLFNPLFPLSNASTWAFIIL